MVEVDGASDIQPSERGSPAQVDDGSSMHAVGLEIGDLTADFVLVEIVVPEPEGHDGEGWGGEWRSVQNDMLVLLSGDWGLGTGD
ncbi:MAG: hypothetical protein R2856_38005 [Caldilineaceae bacterium]